MKKNKLFVFDQYDNLLTVTDNYIEAIFEETIEKPISLEITFPAQDNEADFFVGGNQVAFRDLKNNFRLFTIREVDDRDGEATEKVVQCMPSMQELMDSIVEEQRPQNQTAEYALGVLLKNSRWQVGEVAELGQNSAEFYFKNAYECLGNLVSIWGGEIVDRIELTDNKITGRFIDIVHRKGTDTGKRFEIDKDIKEITRTVLYYPKTALYGKGASLESTDKVTFRDVVWSKENGDPVDKPKGQEWVGEPEVLDQHGIPNQSTGQMMHRFDVFEDNDEEDSQQLLEKTWRALESVKAPKVQYEMSIMTFYDRANDEHEQVFLGDTGIARDKNIKPMILVESRILSHTYDIGDPSTGEVILGNILNLNPDDRIIDWVVDQVRDHARDWGSGEIGPITDDQFPDRKPDIPANFTADGLFKTIMLSWDFETTYAIAAYEVYASRLNGFTPHSTNLVFRGKVGGYHYETGTDEKWYFRVRAVNTHGTPSDYSNQESASTVQLDFPDLRDMIPAFIEYSIYEGEESPDPNEYTFWIHTGEQPILLYQWNEEREEWTPLAPTNPEDLGAVGEDEYNQKISEIEQTENEIRLSVGELTTVVDDQNIKINNNQSAITQNAEQITFRVEQTTYDADMDDMNTRVSKSESSIIQNAEEIELRVSKNGVVSSINQSAEEIKIQAERISIDGDLVVSNGKVYIKDGVITDTLIANNAQIDFAKIGNVTITNAMIQSLDASKINTGILDAGKVFVRVRNGTQSIQMDDTGFRSVDDNGNVRIHIGIRDIAGKGESSPTTIRFFTGSGDKSVGVGMNVNDTFVVGSSASGVFTEYRSKENTFHYANEHRFVTTNTSSTFTNQRYWRMLGTINSSDIYHPMFIPSADGYGYIGSPSYYLFQVRTKNVYYHNLYKVSTRASKTDIKLIDISEMNRVFEEITLKSFKYLADEDSYTESFGVIAEEAPSEILANDGKAVNQDNFVGVIAGSLKYQIDRINLHDNKIVALQNEVNELKKRLNQLEGKLDGTKN